jgi:DNA-binding MarR family transcriptional regulator
MQRQPPATISGANVILRVFVLGQLVGAQLEPAIAPSGLRPSEFAVESVIRAFQPLSPTRLATQLGMPPTTLSAQLRRAVERGHVRRAPHPSDGRSHLLELTAEGEAAVRLGIAGLEASLAAIDGELARPRAEIEEAFAELERALRAILARHDQA